MIACILAAVVFGVLGLFSAKYRMIAKEAVRCAFRTITLRKCDTTLDLKLKSTTTAKLARFPKLASFTYKHFELISLVLLLAFSVSGVYFSVGIYNYARYGNCNGEDSTAFCPLDPYATGEHGYSRNTCTGSLIKPSSLAGDIFGNGSVVVVEFGCYACPYTKNAEPAVESMLSEYGEDITFVFKPVVLPKHAYAREMITAVECAKEQGKYWEYRKAVFANQREVREGGMLQLGVLSTQVGLNQMEFSACMNSGRYSALIDNLTAEADSSGIYGTPTFFIGNQTFTGTVDYNQLKTAIEAEISKG